MCLLPPGVEDGTGCVWQALASAPSARVGHVAIGTQLTTSTDGGLLLIGAPTDPVLVVHGGVEASASASQPLASVMVYNVTANTWWEHSSFHAPALVGHGAVVYDKQMCVAIALLFSLVQSSQYSQQAWLLDVAGGCSVASQQVECCPPSCMHTTLVRSRPQLLPAHTHTHSHAMLWWRAIR